MLDSITKWPFLNEPLYRWAIFLLALILIMGTWGMILGYMKSA